MTLDAAIRAFLRSCTIEKNLSPLTVGAYKADLSQLRKIAAKPVIRDVEAVTPEFIRSYIERLKCDGHYADASIRRKIAVLRAFIAYLERLGAVSQNPLAHIRFAFHQSKRLPSVLSRPDVREMLAIAKKNSATSEGAQRVIALRDYALLEMLFYSGARIGELIKVGVNDIDLRTGFLKVRGKGRRERVLWIGCDVVISAVRRYLIVRKPISQNVESLILNRRGTKLGISSAEAAIKRIAQAAHVPGRVTPHVFRHTMATMMLENGADLRSIQEILGHAALSTTEIYTHISTRRKQDVMREFHPRHHNDSRGLRIA